MALYDGVNGVSREVTKIYDSVGGVARIVLKAYDSVDGVARQYFSGTLTVGVLAVGSSVWLNVNGTQKEFLVVHQGNPDSALYDESCNGTWLLMKYVYSKEYWDTDEYDREDEYIVESMSNDYDASDIHKWHVSSFGYNLNRNVRSAIKEVKIPYYRYGDSVVSGSNGLSTKFFLLSGYEVGFTNSDDSTLPADGACLDYFVGATAATRKAYYNGSATYWWLRSPNRSDYEYSFRVDTYGYLSDALCNKQYGMRPAFILDSDTPITQSDGKNIIE